MPDYKGRIFGRSVLDVRFRAFYGEDLFLGTRGHRSPRR